MSIAVEKKQQQKTFTQVKTVMIQAIAQSDLDLSCMPTQSKDRAECSCQGEEIMTRQLYRQVTIFPIFI